MKILFFGDIYGRLGRDILARELPHYRTKFAPDFVIANCENMSHGRGVLERHVRDLLAAGVDAATSGNHIFDLPDGYTLLADQTLPVIRPANYPARVVGRGHLVLEKNGRRLFVTNLMGRVFMGDPLDNPFEKADALLAEAAKLEIKHVFVDFHAEATSEKYALAHYLDGRASVVVGTHTHVQTADERILPGGTAAISDVGFCGPRDSVIGAEKGPAVTRFLTGLAAKLVPAESGEAVLGGVLVTLDETTGRAVGIERIYDLFA